VSEGSSLVSYGYDAVGNLTNSVVFPDTSSTNSLTTAYAYDAAERLESFSSGLSTGDLQTFDYAYSPQNGRISSITNLESGLVTSYAYDIMDRATNISYRTSTGGLIRSLSYQYDALGMITNVVTSDDSSQLSVKSYRYDTLNRLVREGSCDSWAEYSYDLAGNRLAKTSGSATVNYQLGTGDRLASWTAVSTNGFARLTRAATIRGNASETLGTDSRWGRRALSNAVLQEGSSVVTVDGTNYTGTLVLQAGTQTVVAAVSDMAGNVGYATNTVSLSVVTNAQYFSDAAGCLTNIILEAGGQQSGVNLTWDERYRLTSVSSAGAVVNYSYDVYGRRASRTENSNYVFYVYNGNQVVADLDESGNLLRSYTWGPGIDNLLAMTVYTNGGAQASATYYAIKDHLNSIIAFVDTNGSVVEFYEYDAWGRTRIFDANGDELTESAISNRYCFQGREIDWTTGFYYFRARWYDPATGRWLSKDPIGISGGLNLYAFCGNNPVNFTDPLGLCENNGPLGMGGLGYLFDPTGGSYLAALGLVLTPEPGTTIAGGLFLLQGLFTDIAGDGNLDGDMFEGNSLDGLFDSPEDYSPTGGGSLEGAINGLLP
jgi:RHS repeat-associated protein